ncbi:MAG: SMC-Scp complex subunit ScpB [Candidatus Hodarchaeales archaeon]
MTSPSIMDEVRLTEALLYIMEKSVSTSEIAEIIQKSEEEVQEVIQTLREIYLVTKRPYEIAQEGDHYILKLKPVIVEKIKETDLVKTGKVPQHLIGLAAYLAFNEYVKKEQLTVAQLKKKRGAKVIEMIDELEKAGLILTKSKGKTKVIKMSKNFLILFNLPTDNPEIIGKFLKEKIYETATKMFSSDEG